MGKRKAKIKAKQQALAGQDDAQCRARLIADVERTVCQATGVKTPALANQLLLQTQTVVPSSAETDEMTLLVGATAMLHELNPTTALEGMLATQMLGVHQTAMAFLARANAPGQTLDGAATNGRLAIRLLQLFPDQLEAMAKLKGKARQQHVTVEHMHVHQGGQAIVGAVAAATKSKAGEGGP